MAKFLVNTYKFKKKYPPRRKNGNNKKNLPFKQLQLTSYLFELNKSMFSMCLPVNIQIDISILRNDHILNIGENIDEFVNIEISITTKIERNQLKQLYGSSIDIVASGKAFENFGENLYCIESI